MSGGGHHKGGMPPNSGGDGKMMSNAQMKVNENESNLVPILRAAASGWNPKEKMTLIMVSFEGSPMEMSRMCGQDKMGSALPKCVVLGDGISVLKTTKDVSERMKDIATRFSKEQICADPTIAERRTDVVTQAVVEEAYNSCPYPMVLTMPNLQGSSDVSVYSGGRMDFTDHPRDNSNSILSIRVEPNSKIHNRTVLQTRLSSEEKRNMNKISRITDDDLSRGVGETVGEYARGDQRKYLVEDRDHDHPVMNRIRQRFHKDDNMSSDDQRREIQKTRKLPESVMVINPTMPGTFVVNAGVFDHYRDELRTMMREGSPLSDVANHHGEIQPVCDFRMGPFWKGSKSNSSYGMTPQNDAYDTLWDDERAIEHYFDAARDDPYGRYEGNAKTYAKARMTQRCRFYAVIAIKHVPGREYAQ